MTTKKRDYCSHFCCYIFTDYYTKENSNRGLKHLYIYTFFMYIEYFKKFNYYFILLYFDFLFMHQELQKFT